MFTLLRRKQVRKVFHKSKKRRCSTFISHVNSNDSNNLHKSNSDNVIVTSKISSYERSKRQSIKFTSSFTKISDIDSSASIIDEIMDKNNIGEAISSDKNSSEIIDHTYDDNGINSVNIEEEYNVTFIISINAINDISMNYGENYMHKYYAPFLSSKNHADIFSGT